MCEGFLCQISLSLSLQVLFSVVGFSYLLIEVQIYLVEVCCVEELVSWFENQVFWYEGVNVVGLFNFSQVYWEWGMVEFEVNCDYYGLVCFDDINFQMSIQG